MRFVRKISDRGVLTIPTEVREALDVGDGDIVEFEVLRVVKAKSATNPNQAGSLPGGVKA
ncbi:MAG: AbrB/MazE/SpoVT family DNA-binding domain-containing protein [Candidatus Thermoplasmatota archaeon]